MIIIYEEYDDEESAFAEASIRGFLRIRVNLDSSSYVVWFYTAGRLRQEMEASLSEIGSIYFSRAIIVVGEEITKNLVEDRISVLSDKKIFFDSLREICTDISCAQVV